MSSPDLKTFNMIFTKAPSCIVPADCDVILPKQLRFLDYGWCLVVRPDRTVLHDGPSHEADRLVQETLTLLGSPAA